MKRVLVSVLVLASVLLAGCGTLGSGTVQQVEDIPPVAKPEPKPAPKPLAEAPKVHPVSASEALPGAPGVVSKPTPRPAPKPVAVAAPAAKPVPVAVTPPPFPTSKNKGEGKAWNKMGGYAYKGSIPRACELLGLSGAECAKFMQLRTEEKCRTMDVPNGVVLDGLTYTVGPNHHSQKNVLVDLKDPPTRSTLVCDLGGGTYVLHFLGCGNYGVVRGFIPPQPKVVAEPPRAQVVIPPAPLLVVPSTPTAICPSGEFSVATFIWSPEALGVTRQVRDSAGNTRVISAQQVIDDMKRAGASDPHRGNALARFFGGTFFAKAKAGELQQAEATFPARYEQVKADGTVHKLWEGQVGGTGRPVDVPIPNFEDGDTIRITVTGAVASPLSSISARKAEWRTGCKAATHGVAAPAVSPHAGVTIR